MYLTHSFSRQSSRNQEQESVRQFHCQATTIVKAFVCPIKQVLAKQPQISITIPQRPSPRRFRPETAGEPVITRTQYLLQGGGTPQGPPQETHRFTGKIGAQRIIITINRETCSYSTLYIEGREREQKCTKQSPRPGGTHSGHTNDTDRSIQSNNPPDHVSAPSSQM